MSSTAAGAAVGAVGDWPQAAAASRPATARLKPRDTDVALTAAFPTAATAATPR